jgi:hypothetical protein
MRRHGALEFAFEKADILLLTHLLILPALHR